MEPTQFSYEQTLLFLLPVFVASIISAGNAFYAWMHRDVKEAWAFFWVSLDVVLLSLFTGGFDLSPTREIAIIWYRLRFISLTTLPVFFLIFSLQFTNRDHLLSRARVLLLFIVPLISQMILWFASDFFTSDIVLKLYGSLMIVESDVNQVGFTIHFIYSVSCAVLGLVLIAVHASQSERVFRGQAVALLLGTLPPFLVSAVMATFFARSNMQMMPLSMSLMGVIYSWALFRYRLLDLVPVAETMLIRSMDDGLLVFDNYQRLVEMNPVAEALLGHTAEESIGIRFGEGNSPKDTFMQNFATMAPGQVNIQLGKGEKHLEARVIVLTDRRGRGSGRMVVLHDISELFQAMRKLGLQVHEIQVLQHELEKTALRDSVTGLYNRHCLAEVSVQELSRARRELHSTCFTVVGIDSFQSLTDLFGQEAGDALLRALAQHLTACVREMDIVCRLDSERIVIMVPRSKADVISVRAEEWRKSFLGTQFTFNTVEVKPTISIEIASFPEHGETAQQVIDAACQALEACRENGFNCTEISAVPS